MTHSVYCRSTSLCRSRTSQRQLQRWSCRDCGRSVTAAKGTPTARIHSLEKLHVVALDMLAEAPGSCRRLAAALGVDHMTVCRWRRAIAIIWASLEPLPTSDKPEAATVVMRESRKFSRKLVYHCGEPTRYSEPDRLRWIDYRQLDLPLPAPMTPYHVPMQLAGGAGVPSSGPDGPVAAEVCSTVATSSLSCRPIDRQSEASSNATPRAGKSVSGQPRGRLDKTLPEDKLGRQFLRFITPFRGPATRHLDTYVAWFAVRVGAPH